MSFCVVIVYEEYWLQFSNSILIIDIISIQISI